MATPAHRGPIVLAGVTSLALVAAPWAWAGPSWDGDLEGDAGQVAGTAQVISTSASWSILHITGNLRGNGFLESDFVDMYRIQITSQTLISISTAGGSLGGSADFDTQLFLFRQRGGNGSNQRAVALRGNNDAAPGNSGSRIGDQAAGQPNAVLVSPGWYYIAIAGVGSRAFNDEGQFIWPDLGDPGDVVDGQGATLSDWTDDGVVGSYTIVLKSLSQQNVPSPGALALFGAGALLGRRRRR